MRIRKPEAFGHGLLDFHIDVPDAPALACIYRLKMFQGEWWLDNRLGVPWETQVIGRNTNATRDLVLFSTMISTQGVTAVTKYSSDLDRNSRHFTVSATIMTQYSVGPTTIGNIALGVAPSQTPESRAVETGVPQSALPEPTINGSPIGVLIALTK